MENLDVLVLRTLRDWRMAGKAAMLVTVVRTWGSSPRPVGSIMALCQDGSLVGSVSGGCVEDDLFDRYRCSRMPAAGTSMDHVAPTLLKYGVSADEAHRFGLPCGGTLELLLELNPDARALVDLVHALEHGILMRRTVGFADGQVALGPAQAGEGLLLDDASLTNVFGPGFRMLLIGAGQLAEYLATMALFSGFSVTVCDPRDEYSGSWSVDGAKVVHGMPDDVVAAFRPDRRSCVIALSHDPKLDDLALLEALRSDAFYVGAIGSRRNNQARHQRLMQHFDVAAADLQRLHGPIGIYIASKTPPEIAVSIMAEVLAVKNGLALPPAVQVAHAKNLEATAKTGQVRA